MPVTPALSADNLRRLLLLRGISLLAAIAMAFLAQPLFHVLPDLQALILVCGVWALFGAATWWRTMRPHPVRRVELLLHLAADLLLLTVFLVFSGGTANPLTALYLMPVAAAAAVLPLALAWAIAGVAVAAYALLWLLAVPIVVEDVDAAMQMHLTGMWLTFGLSAALLVGIVARMSAALREREQRLTAARERSLRDERIVALGSLAAGAAHQLGTPLNTMALLAGEIVANAMPGSDISLDAQELNAQVERCRDIVRKLMTDAGISQPAEAITVSDWLSHVVTRFRLLRGDCAPTVQIGYGIDERPIRPDATLTQVVTDLLDNAADASPAKVSLAMTRIGSDISITICDAGAGFSAAALARIGREPWSDKPQGMGLGLYLAHAIVERLGGRVECRNAVGGAVVELRIPVTVLS